MSETSTTPEKRATKLATSETETTPGEIAADTDSEASRDAIAQRAYEIAQGPEAGSNEENWLRAEHELRRSSNAGG